MELDITQCAPVLWMVWFFACGTTNLVEFVMVAIQFKPPTQVPSSLIICLAASMWSSDNHANLLSICVWRISFKRYVSLIAPCTSTSNVTWIIFNLVFFSSVTFFFFPVLSWTWSHGSFSLCRNFSCFVYNDVGVDWICESSNSFCKIVLFLSLRQLG